MEDYIQLPMKENEKVENVKRRNFLKKAGIAAVGAGLFALPMMSAAPVILRDSSTDVLEVTSSGIFTNTHTLYGGKSASNNLTLKSTTHGTKGRIDIGAQFHYSEASEILGIGKVAGFSRLEVQGITGGTVGATFDHTSGNNGAASNRIQFVNTATTALSNQTALACNAFANPASSAPGAVTHALFGSANMQAGNNNNYGTIKGLFFAGGYSGSGSCVSTIGCEAFTSCTGGGTVTTGIGMWTFPQVTSGTVTTWYGYYMTAQSGGGTITTPWGFYEIPDFPNYFEGSVGIGTTTRTAAKLHVDQASTTAAIPVLTLDQADISEEMISFETTIGTGNAIEAVGAKALTTTHFIKVTLPGGLTRYIPAGTIA